MSLTFVPVRANEHENGALLGTLKSSGKSGGVYSFYFDKPEYLKIVGDQLFIEDGFHFDYENSSFVKISETDSGGYGARSFVPSELTWPIKYSLNSGSSKWDYVSLEFLDKLYLISF